MNSYDEHPVKLFNECGIPFTFCLDNWLLSGDFDHQPDPNGELIEAAKLIGWHNVKKAMISGAKAAFSPIIDQPWIDQYSKKLEALFSAK